MKLPESFYKTPKKSYRIQIKRNDDYSHAVLHNTKIQGVFEKNKSSFDHYNDKQNDTNASNRLKSQQKFEEFKLQKQDMNKTMVHPTVNQYSGQRRIK